MFYELLAVAGLFQSAEQIGRSLTKSQQRAMQPIPKLVTATWVKILCKFHRQRPVAGANQVFAKLFFIGREDAYAAPTARNRDIPLLRARRGFGR